MQPSNGKIWFINLAHELCLDNRATIIKRIDGIVLKIQIQRGYRFTIEGNFAYKQFREYFGIGGAKGEFSIKDFVNHFSNQVPSEYLLSDKKRKIILRYDKLDNKSEGIYPIGIINWKIVHAKNPSLSNDRYHRTGKNLAKTKQLYPLIFEATKELDITIIYGKKSGEQTEDIKFGKYFFSKD